MKSPIPDYLAEVLDNCGADSGERADHIPQLAAADPDLLGVAVATVSGSLYTAGDTDVEVSIQSVSKPFVYALALCDLGTDAVDAKIDVEPSGDAFTRSPSTPGPAGRATR